MDKAAKLRPDLSEAADLQPTYVYTNKHIRKKRWLRQVGSDDRQAPLSHSGAECAWSSAQRYHGVGVLSGNIAWLMVLLPEVASWSAAIPVKPEGVSGGPILAGEANWLPTATVRTAACSVFTFHWPDDGFAMPAWKLMISCRLPARWLCRTLCLCELITRSVQPANGCSRFRVTLRRSATERYVPWSQHNGRPLSEGLGLLGPAHLGPAARLRAQTRGATSGHLLEGPGPLGPSPLGLHETACKH